MMKRANLAVAIVAAWGLLALCRSAWAEDSVYFPDPYLKAAVEEELDVTDPTPTDMLDLIYLSADYSNIENLTGLEYATNLIGLQMQYNQISNISAISGLTNLTSLYLGGNQISDCSVVAGLTNLTRLALYSNLISDCSAVSELTNLNVLYLYDNQISNCNDVSGLTKLWTLGLQDNQISDISSISGLTNLTWLTLGNNQISDCNIVSQLTKLTNLELYGNQISNISAVSELTTLDRLYLYDNQISDISAVSELKNLTRLTLGNNPISDISVLSDHTNLSVLSLYDNLLNTPAYCTYLPLILANNPGIDLIYDSNPNPLTKNCETNLNVLATFVAHWLETDCNEGNNWCGWADLDHVYGVDLYDFSELAKYWVGGVSSYMEDVETQGFYQYGWQNSVDVTLIVVSDHSYQGSYSAKSGSISHGQHSVLEITPDIEVGYR